MGINKVAHTIRLSIFLLLSVLLTESAFSQSDSTAWQEDALASTYVSKGKQSLAAGKYLEAIAVLDSALERPFNPQTTSAEYLRGLALFYQGKEEKAMKAFEAFMEKYQASTYLPEVSYHYAILQLEGWPDERGAGIETLLGLWRQDSLPSLSAEAKQQLQQYFFSECDTSTLSELISLGSADEISFFLEPYCYCLTHKLDAPKIAKMVYEEYQYQYGETLPFLERLFDTRKEDRYGDRENIKIAVFLPLFLQEGIRDSTRSVPRRSKIALEFWEGFQMAYQQLEPSLKRRITLRVFDTKRDSATVAGHLQELDTWYPDLIVGAVYNKQTEIISKWSEATGTPQIVPFSPNGNLVLDKQFTFLAHPDIAVHGNQLATYGFDSLGIKKVAVFSNGTTATEKLAAPFIEGFLSKGGEVIRLTVDSSFSNDGAKEIISLTRSLNGKQCDGVFIPIFGDQETTGLILSQMSVMEMNVPVLASPHAWKRFNNIDRELKERFSLTFSTSFMCESQDTAYRSYLKTCLEQYKIPPSDFHTQGYDVGDFVLSVVNEYPFRYLSLSDYIRNYPAKQGFHQSIEFKGSQINQSVNLGQYREGHIKKLPTAPEWIISSERDE